MTQPSTPCLTGSAPGRVNLIGEWIDFNGGTVVPMALPQKVTIEVAPSKDGHDRIRSAQFAGEAVVDIDASATGDWWDYVCGALQLARRRGWIDGGREVLVDSSVPVGAGLSSSAATIIATLKAVAPVEVLANATELALAAQRIEHDYIGVPCGIMDQMAIAVGSSEEALVLNTKDLSFEQLRVPKDWQFIVFHSGIGRALADGQYRQRRDECADAARQLDEEYLCDASAAAAEHLPSPLNLRARHVISEHQRSLNAAKAIVRGDAERFGELMSESHASLRDDFMVSVEPIDIMVADALRLGALGARITGAGFGGCFVCLTASQYADRIAESLQALHPSIRRIT
ncbi:MAG: galactokinase [Pseudomonadota bacterium]|nr:galactokinase [Pseudomonadota bacterium]